jgi:hypothetical protein
MARCSSNSWLPAPWGLIGPVLAEDVDRLLEAIASLAPGAPISLDLTEVTSIDEGGVVAIRRAGTKAHDIGGSWSFFSPHPRRSTGSEIVVYRRIERGGWFGQPPAE